MKQYKSLDFAKFVCAILIIVLHTAPFARKHDIKYSMEGGTLLGAVKYQNFVPWDDDIGVIMLRSEYEKFLSVSPDEIGEDYFLQSYHNVSEFPLNYAKLCYRGAEIRDYDYSHLKKMSHGIFMDIFPIDEVRPDSLRKHCSFVGVFTGARKIKLGVDLGKMPFVKGLVYKTLSFLPIIRAHGAGLAKAFL